MSEADRLFEELGYKKTINFKEIVYENGDKIITFNLDKKSITCTNFYDGFESIDMQELQAINKKCEEMRMELKKEWKEIRGYENKYIISNYGEIISLPRYKKNNSKLQYVEPKEILRYTNSTNGYVYVQLCKDGDCKNIRLHRLVAETFIPNPRNLPQVNHKDGNKENNCVNNLEWCTNQENVKHAYKIGLAKSKNKIKVNQYDLNGKFIKQYNSLTEASKQSRVSISKISTCINGKYKYKNKSKNKYIWKIGEESV